MVRESTRTASRKYSSASGIRKFTRSTTSVVIKLTNQALLNELHWSAFGLNEFTDEEIIKKKMIEYIKSLGPARSFNMISRSLPLFNLLSDHPNHKVDSRPVVTVYVNDVAVRDFLPNHGLTYAILNHNTRQLTSSELTDVNNLFESQINIGKLALSEIRSSLHKFFGHGQSGGKRTRKRRGTRTKR
jgi:hypothetical protein